MAYGSAARVKDLLSNAGEDFTADQEARIAQLLEVVSRVIEEKTGAIFGDATAETVEEVAEGGRVLYLSKGLRSVTSVVENPTTWSGTAWSGGTTLAATDYRLSGRHSKRSSDATVTTCYRTIERIGGAWSGRYIITGVWEDRLATVPDDVDYLASYLAAEIFKKQKASPAGFVGPDNAVVPVRNTLNEPEVKAILDRWRVGPVMWVVT